MSKELCPRCLGAGTVVGAYRDGGGLTATESPCECVGNPSGTMDLPGTAEVENATNRAVQALEANLNQEIDKETRRAILEARTRYREIPWLNFERLKAGLMSREDYFADLDFLVEEIKREKRGA